MYRQTKISREISREAIRSAAAIHSTQQSGLFALQPGAKAAAERQTVSDIRVSAWAIAVAVIIGLAAIGWVLLQNK
jgi:uncharacterized protein HemX